MRNAFLSNHVARDVVGSQSVLTAFGSAIRSYNWLPLPGPTPATSTVVRTSNGAPDCAWKIPDASQLPSTHRSGAADDSNVGKRYRTCDTSTCGRSRSEMP